MNSDDHFEKRLQRQAFRPVPAAWREEVLSAARAAAAPAAPPLFARRRPFAAPHGRLVSWLWPHPAAWVGLAALWLLVLGFTFANRESGQPALAGRTAPPSPEIRELLKEQEQWLAELLGPSEPPEFDRPKSTAPQPRSQRREGFLRA